MKELTKKQFFEEIYINEEKKPDDQWPIITLSDPLIFYIEEFINSSGRHVKIKTKDQETGELVDGLIKSTRIRRSPNGKELLEFNNYEGGIVETKRRWIELDYNRDPVRFVDIKPGLIDGTFGHLDLPKSFGMYGYVNKSRSKSVTNPEVNKDTKEEFSKRKINKFINSFFDQSSIILKLNLMGIAPIEAGAKYTEKTTNVERKFDFIGPELYFKYHSQYNFSSFNEILDKIQEYRYLLDNNLPIPTELLGVPEHQVRQYANYIYRNGKWSPRQRIADKKHYELTKIRKLAKKNVQKGEKKIATFTDMTVNTYRQSINKLTMVIEFSVTNDLRTYGKEWGIEMGQLFPKIIVHTTKEFSSDTEFSELTVLNYSGFYRELFVSTLGKLKEAILNLDEDEILYKQVQDPSIMGYEHEYDF